MFGLINMKYKIEYSYNTGDSFGSSTETGQTDYIWENLDIAKQNLQRIRDHYSFYTNKERPPWKETKDDAKNRLEKAKKEPWFVDSRHGFYHSVKLLTDDGKDFVFNCPWCGYFESLNGAKIVPDNTDMEITF